MPTDPTPQTEQGACTHCGRTKAGHVRYSNFGDVPFCGHPEYGLKVFTEPSPAPQTPGQSGWLQRTANRVRDEVTELPRLRERCTELESALTTMTEERDRAQDALRTIVASDDVWEMLEIARTTLKPVSDRQPEGETVVPREAQQLFEETEKIDQMRDDSDWHMAVCLFESAITKIFRLCSQEGEKSDAI